MTGVETIRLFSCSGLRASVSSSSVLHTCSSVSGPGPVGDRLVYFTLSGLYSYASSTLIVPFHFGTPEVYSFPMECCVLSWSIALQKQLQCVIERMSKTVGIDRHGSRK